MIFKSNISLTSRNLFQAIAIRHWQMNPWSMSAHDRLAGLCKNYGRWIWWKHVLKHFFPSLCLQGLLSVVFLRNRCASLLPGTNKMVCFSSQWTISKIPSTAFKASNISDKLLCQNQRRRSMVYMGCFAQSDYFFKGKTSISKIENFHWGRLGAFLRCPHKGWFNHFGFAGDSLQFHKNRPQELHSNIATCLWGQSGFQCSTCNWLVTRKPLLQDGH